MTRWFILTRKAHLIGSINVPNAEMAMTSVADLLGDCCSRIPDGETGERGYWIRWQNSSFSNCKGLKLEIVKQTIPGFKDTIERPFYNIDKGIDPSSLDLGELGYAAEAIKSYKIFKKLKEKKIIGEKVRFQVSIPSAMALVIGFIVKKDQLEVEPAVVTAIKKDLTKLQSAIKPEELAIQFDICQEIVGYDGGAKIPYDDILEGSVKRIADLCDHVETAVDVGIHLCYGDPGHKHIVEPKDLNTSVSFANGITCAAKRTINFIHMAVPINRSDDAYFMPLKNLRTHDRTQLILGLIHYSDGFDGSKNRLMTAEKFVKEFDIATECGFGRRPSETMPELLQIHRDLCDFKSAD